MEFRFVDLDEGQAADLESRLEEYDEKLIRFKMEGRISLGIEDGGRIIAGADAVMTAFHILYVSTVFVDEAYRRQGIGRSLMEELERRAVRMGADMIRLDTFDWQGYEFYLALGYEEAGSYTNEKDGFSEYFLLKRL